MKAFILGSLLLLAPLLVPGALAHNGEYKPPPGRTKPPGGGKNPVRHSGRWSTGG